MPVCTPFPKENAKWTYPKRSAISHLIEPYVVAGAKREQRNAIHLESIRKNPSPLPVFLQSASLEICKSLAGHLRGVDDYAAEDNPASTAA